MKVCGGVDDVRGQGDPFLPGKFWDDSVALVPTWNGLPGCRKSFGIKPCKFS
jgi:hypothetical protein